MQLITDLDALPTLSAPCGLTLGTFDGVHLGHQKLIQHLRSKLPQNAKLVCFTFTDHPSHLFNPDSPTSLICTAAQKAKLLGEYGADVVILTAFSAEFAAIPYDQFLKDLRKKIPFSHFVLGTGATFGKQREGNPENIKTLASEMGFTIEYLPKLEQDGAPISSGRIRKAIAEGNFSLVRTCLGRPYSLMGRVLQEKDHFLLYEPGICLPPPAIYPIQLKASGKSYLGRGHINPPEQMIRLDLLETQVPLAKKEVEIVFL